MDKNRLVWYNIPLLYWSLYCMSWNTVVCYLIAWLWIWLIYLMMESLYFNILFLSGINKMSWFHILPELLTSKGSCIEYWCKNQHFYCLFLKKSLLLHLCKWSINLTEKSLCTVVLIHLQLYCKCCSKKHHYAQNSVILYSLCSDKSEIVISTWTRSIFQYDS